VRAQNDAAFPAFDLALQDFFVMKRYVKAPELASEQIYSI
jgi:hypothetical protein